MTRYNFVLYGQSNASGRGTGAAPVYEHNNRIFNFRNNGVWEVASEPIDSATGTTADNDPSWDGPAAANGFGMAFANRLCELHDTVEIGLIPCARGGTRLAQFRAIPNTKNLYGRMSKRVVDSSDLGTLAGILFWQGEADTRDPKIETLKWSDNFGNLVARSRTDFGNAKLPWAYVRLNNLRTTQIQANASGQPYWNTLRQLQTNLSISNVVMVSSDGAAFQTDKTHCTTAGYVTMGIRIADAIDPLVDWS